MMVVSDVVRVEDGAENLCEVAGVSCAKVKKAEAAKNNGNGDKKNSNSHSGEKRIISWEELRRADETVYSRVKSLAVKLGYVD